MDDITDKKKKAPERELTKISSFAPVRDAGAAKWYVDGKDYMSAVAHAIGDAQHEIFITDWQMDPHIFLERHPDGVQSSESMLLDLLQEKARNGVKVYVLLYRPITFLDYGSEAVESALKGEANIEVYRHPIHSPSLSDVLRPLKFIKNKLLWSHHEKVVVVDRSIAFVGGIDLCYGRWDTQAHDLVDDYPAHPDVDPASVARTDKRYYRRWVGLDYRNTFRFENGKVNFDEHWKDHVKNVRKEHPRLPWHDVSCSFTGEAVKDVARHFIQRFNFIKSSGKLKLSNDRQLSHEFHHHVNHTITEPSTDSCKIQVLRSVGESSIGLEREYSIQQAYCVAIKKAEHFIYIENQFFISDQPRFDVENQIQPVLCERIIRAHQNNERFHVIIILPLKPEFKDKWGKNNIIFQQSWRIYVTLFLEENSLMKRLEKKISKEDIPKYIGVYGLRTHGILDGKPTTEIIYVHSKVMIVDDRKAIIGSANINDRSMNGDFDSEVCVMIEDNEMIDGSMNGESYKVGRFSHGLRCDLLKEHLGCTYSDLEDPLTDNFRNLFKRAANNTKIYEKVFKKVDVLPSNLVRTFRDLIVSEPRVLAPPSELANLCGNIVTFPRHFFQVELTGSIGRIDSIRDKFLNPILKLVIDIDDSKSNKYSVFHPKSPLDYLNLAVI